jgi:hypothetical protein
VSDDFSKAIKQIGEMLSQDKGRDNLMSLLSLLGSSGSRNNELKEVKKEGRKENEENTETLEKLESNHSKDGNRDSSHDNMELVRQITNIMGKLNTKHDPRVHLLTSLKPFLSHRRRNKLNNCIMLLQLTSIVRAMDANKESDSDGI